MQGTIFCLSLFSHIRYPVSIKNMRITIIYIEVCEYANGSDFRFSCCCVDFLNKVKLRVFSDASKIDKLGNVRSGMEVDIIYRRYLPPKTLGGSRKVNSFYSILM